MPTQFNIVNILATLVALVVGISVHEFSHAWSANMLGDPTAKQQGRLSLNPMVHFDPIGFMMLVLMSFGFFGITWGRPVPINPYRIRGGRHGMALSSVAGPVSNLIVATVFGLSIRLVPQWVAQLPEGFQVLLFMIVIFNVLLAIFNLIPIPPLDGFNVLEGVVPGSWVPALQPVRQYGMPILLMLIFMGPLLHLNLLGGIISPAQQFVLGLLLGNVW